MVKSWARFTSTITGRCKRGFAYSQPCRCRGARKWESPAYSITTHKAFVRTVIAAGLDPKQVVRHTLRHTAITHLVQAGVDLPTVKRISGHKKLAMVERYTQSGSHIASALEKLDARYQSDKKPA